jgi:hypothetical protein
MLAMRLCHFEDRAVDSLEPLCLNDLPWLRAAPTVLVNARWLPPLRRLRRSA